MLRARPHGKRRCAKPVFPIQQIFSRRVRPGIAHSARLLYLTAAQPDNVSIDFHLRRIIDAVASGKLEQARIFPLTRAGFPKEYAAASCCVSGIRRAAALTKR